MNPARRRQVRKTPRADAYVKLRVLSPRMVGRLRWWSRVVRELRGVLAEDMRNPAELGAALKLAGRGFLPSSRTIYQLDGPQARDYVSDRQRELTWAIDWPAAGLLDDKLAFFLMLRYLGVPTPEVSGVIVRGRAYELGSEAPATARGEWLRARLEERGKLIVRPTRGGGGRALWVLELDSPAYRINGERVRWSELSERLGQLEDHLVTDFAEQAPYASEIFPGTTNTIRVLTMNRSETGPMVAAAVHRIGTQASAPADNWSKGGLSVALDVETGVLGQAVLHPRGGRTQWLDRHPDTGVVVAGTQVPGWADARAGILSLATRLPFVPYVGWDVMMVDGGGHAVIEGNKYSDVNLLQVHAPIMRNPAARAFYADHGLA